MSAARPAAFEQALRDYQSLPPQAARARAAARLSELGWPSARDEEWRYANLRAFQPAHGFKPAGTSAQQAATALRAVPEGTVLPPPVPGFERLIYIDGIAVHGAASLQGADGGAARTAGWDWSAGQRLGWLCEMFAGDAAHLRVRGRASVEIVFLTSEHAAGACVYPRLQVQLEAGGELTLIEHHLGVGQGQAPALVACNVTIELAREARLTHYRLQQHSLQSACADTLWAKLDANARYTQRSVAIGAGTARTSARVQLAGRGAAVAWQAIAVGRGTQVHDTSLKVEHAAADTSTEELFRGIADERARIAFSGHIHIDASAPGSQARQSLRGLIEGSGAEIDLRPRLEILTDEVRATHGATTGRLDEELLFYMLSRGLDRETARALLKWAFLGDVLREIELPSVRAMAERLAAGQLRDVPVAGVMS